MDEYSCPQCKTTNVEAISEFDEGPEHNTAQKAFHCYECDKGYMCIYHLVEQRPLGEE